MIDFVTISIQSRRSQRLVVNWFDQYFTSPSHQLARHVIGQPQKKCIVSLDATTSLSNMHANSRHNCASPTNNPKASSRLHSPSPSRTPQESPLWIVLEFGAALCLASLDLVGTGLRSMLREEDVGQDQM